MKFATEILLLLVLLFGFSTKSYGDSVRDQMFSKSHSDYSMIEGNDKKNTPFGLKKGHQKKTLCSAVFSTPNFFVSAIPCVIQVASRFVLGSSAGGSEE